MGLAVALLAALTLLGGCVTVGEPAPMPVANVTLNTAQEILHYEGPRVQLALAPLTRGELPEYWTFQARTSSDLLGQSLGEVVLELGTPDFRRRDPPARLWQYRTRRCILDVYFYPAGKDGAERVRHAEVRGQGLYRPGDAFCLDTLRARLDTKAD